MPIIGFLWDYTPAPPFEPGTTFDPNTVGAMSLLLARSDLAFGRLSSPASFDGDLQPMFGGDFYERFHISALSFDLGNLVGEQTRTLTVWNAYRRARVLVSLDLDNAEAITISGQPPAPLQFAPQQERTYDLAIGTDGPPVITATITFAFDESQELVVTITGTRVIAWTWPPNWSDGLLERLEWYTDVITAYRGEEQTRSLRLNPRQSLEFAVLVDGAERRHLEAKLWHWGARVWAVPLWHDGIDLTAPLAAGVTSVPITTGMRDFRAGTLALLLGDNSRSSEVLEIDAVNPSELVLVRPTTQAWPAGTRILPARPARIDSDVGMQRFTGRASTGRLRFNMVEPAEYTADAGATVYRGYPVLEDLPTWSNDPEVSFERKVSEFDPGTGTMSVEDEADMPFTGQQMAWVLDGRVAIDRFRKRLFALRGKQGRIWVPTWTEDFVPVASLGDSAVALDVDWCGFTQHYQAGVNRRDIRIELTSGQVFYRRITSSSEVDANTERLLLDTALGVNVTVSQFALVSFLSLARLASDSVELAWFTGESADSKTTFRSLRHDV